ncbi:39s ribosomal l47, mitochondrial [Olea europaea subsp. europaea]|uniref:Large ribosomal subunit protein uL29m n=1 Tax=Olea europaea subsp. europaea TaxID=158383 RepID=A0A8S0QXB8_OLEEU|nr:39s ribosomal l47, mitochondrial [Olea europaea subsp. europaea]
MLILLIFYLFFIFFFVAENINSLKECFSQGCLEGHFAAARSEASAARAAAASFSTTSKHNPLEEFFDTTRSPDDEKPVVYGRSWKAPELRLKSWDDLNKLWYVLLKEENMLMTQCQMLHAQNLRFPNPERIPKVRKSMCRIKQVLTERAIAEADPRRSAEMKRMINAL